MPAVNDLTGTTEDEAKEAAAAKAAAGRLTQTGIGFLVTLAFYALFAWLGGVALNRGFGVHAPFVASWLMLAVGVSVVKASMSEVADVWHKARVKADISLIAATMAVQHEHSTGGLDDFLAKLSATDDGDNGAYL